MEKYIISMNEIIRNNMLLVVAIAFVVSIGISIILAIYTSRTRENTNSTAIFSSSMSLLYIVLSVIVVFAGGDLSLRSYESAAIASQYIFIVMPLLIPNTILAAIILIPNCIGIQFPSNRKSATIVLIFAILLQIYTFMIAAKM